MTTLRSSTLATTLRVPFDRAYAYLNDPMNQVEWGVHFIKAVRKVDGVVLATTPMGELPLRVLGSKETGVLDFQLGHGPAIPTRLVPSGAGCEYIFTLMQPPGMPDAVWESMALPNLQEELALLKQRLESTEAQS